MNKGVGALAAAALLLASICVYGEETPQSAIIVTATRTAETADAALASVTVLTRRDIERSQANDLPELLRGLTGFDFSRSGGYGKVTSLFLRGTNPGQVLVLIDGIKIGSVSLGTAALEFIPLGEIERIEIVRGPRSSLYGSEAIGGVIQIFTRRGSGPTHGEGAVSVGSFHTSDVQAGVGGAQDNGRFSVHAGRFATRGINARVGDEPDRDGYDSLYGSFHAGYRLGREAGVEIFGIRASGNTEFDVSAPFADETDFTEESGGVRLHAPLGSRWHTTLQAGVSRDEQFNFRKNVGSSESRFDTERRLQTWQNDFILDDRQLLTFGLEKQQDRLASTVNFTKTSRDNDAWFALYQGDFGNHSIQASARRDDNEQFGRHDTGSAAYGYAVTPQLRTFVSYGTGFRAPSFSDLYNPGPFSPGDPNLEPEEAKSVELGIKRHAAVTSWGASLFHTRITNLINLIGANFVPANVASATIDGVELTLSTHTNAWIVAASATAIDPRDEQTDKYLRLRSRYTGRLDVSRRWNRTELGVSLLTQGPRYDDADNTVRLGGYSLFDIVLQHALSRRWRAGARVENLLDKNYQTISGFNNPGRTLFVSLSYQPPAR